jgi:hypothetical protein
VIRARALKLGSRPQSPRCPPEYQATRMWGCAHPGTPHPPHSLHTCMVVACASHLLGCLSIHAGAAPPCTLSRPFPRSPCTVRGPAQRSPAHQAHPTAQAAPSTQEGKRTRPQQPACGGCTHRCGPAATMQGEAHPGPPPPLQQCQSDQASTSHQHVGGNALQQAV